MKTVFTLLSALLILQFASAQQTRRAVVHFKPFQLNRAQMWLDDGRIAHKASALAELPIQDASPFLAYSLVWYADNWTAADRLSITFSDGHSETEPMLAIPDEHAGAHSKMHISHLYFSEKNYRKFRLQYSGTTRLDSVAVHFFDPGVFNVPTQSPALPLRSACPCPQPAYQGRADWCPAGNCPTDPTPVFTTVGHLIVHHSAGTNTANDWAAVVRSIWDFHVNVNGWDDIGYNWLIDPNGVLYEGRGNGLLGAHFCGTNGGTMGVCVLGNYTSVPPTPEAVGKLESLLAWKACDAGIDPLGSGFHASSGLTLKRISGHRDGCSTSCPGNAFYPTLNNVRQSVACQIENDCQGNFVPSPTLLQATNVQPAQVKLEWQDNATNETGYKVERSVSTNANFATIASLPANTFTYTDNGVVPNQNYYYRVKASANCFESNYSNEAFVSTIATSAGEEPGGGLLKIFPNPSQGLVVVSLETPWAGMVRLAVTDATGRQVQSELIFDKKENLLSAELNLEHLPAGTYWVKIWQDGWVGSMPFVRN